MKKINTFFQLYLSSIFSDFVLVFPCSVTYGGEEQISNHCSACRSHDIYSPIADGLKTDDIARMAFESNGFQLLFYMHSPPNH